MAIEPETYYDQAGRHHSKTMRDGLLVETIILRPDERLPDMEPHDELVLPDEAPFDPKQLVFKYRGSANGSTYVARVGLVEARIQRLANGNYEAQVVKGQRRINSRSSLPAGFPHELPAMLWCDRVLVSMR
jgi:hypothetical protein